MPTGLQIYLVVKISVVMELRARDRQPRGLSLPIDSDGAVSGNTEGTTEWWRKPRTTGGVVTTRTLHVTLSLRRRDFGNREQHTTTTAVERAGGQQRSLCRRARETPRVAVARCTYNTCRTIRHARRSFIRDPFRRAISSETASFHSAALPRLADLHEIGASTIGSVDTPHSPSRVMLGKGIYDDSNDDRLIGE